MFYYFLKFPRERPRYNKLKIKNEQHITNKSKIKQKNDELERLEREINTHQSNIENIFTELLKSIRAIYDDFITRITSGKIFTDEILNSVSTAYKSGYIEYLPELYAEKEVANRVRQIEQVLISNNRL